MTGIPLLVGVAGTATEIGKSWTAAALASELRQRGHRVSARKPVQSFDPSDTAPTDAEVLAAATGEMPRDVCPGHRSLPVAMAPPMAADVLGRPRPQLGDLLAELRWPEAAVVRLLETVGGVCSPLAAGAHSAAYLRAVGVDVVLLVADAGLGTIDAVRTALLALDGTDVTVHLNRFDEGDDLHRRNLAWLRDEDGLDPTVRVGALADRLLACRDVGSGRR